MADTHSPCGKQAMFCQTARGRKNNVDVSIGSIGTDVHPCTSTWRPAPNHTMTIQATTHSERQILQTIQGSRRNGNVAVALITVVGSIGFLLASASSFWHLDLLPAGQPSQLLFVPQGLVMGLYGIAGSLLALYLWIGIVLDVGSGENCFDRDSGRLTVRRRGFRQWIEVNLPLDDIQAVKVDIREGLNPRRRLALKLRGRRDLPLTGVGQPMALAVLEASGARLASFLNVPLQGLN